MPMAASDLSVHGKEPVFGFAMLVAVVTVAGRRSYQRGADGCQRLERVGKTLFRVLPRAMIAATAGRRSDQRGDDSGAVPLSGRYRFVMYTVGT